LCLTIKIIPEWAWISKSERGTWDRMDRERRVAIIETWKMIRSPFPIPCVPTTHLMHTRDDKDSHMKHRCDNVWEIIDVDIAGCTLCGMVHICGERKRKMEPESYQQAHSISNNMSHGMHIETDKQKFSQKLPQKRVQKRLQKRTQKGIGKSVQRIDRGNHKPSETIARTKQRIAEILQPSGCPVVVDEGFTICSITGFCLDSREYADSEFMDTVTINMVPSPRQHIVNYDIVLLYTRDILCSEKSEACLLNENRKLNNRIQSTVYRILKEHKYNNAGQIPNLCVITAKTAHRIQNVRICPHTFDVESRERVACSCAKAITRLMMALYRVCPHTISLNKVAYIVTGLLYLMRSGLNMHCTTILPVEPMLQQYLPPESQLQPYFGIKSKCITEVENLVKVNIRVLDPRRLEHVGVSNVDDIILRV
jgi:hypothetical protein